MMTTDIILGVLGWSALISYVLLIVWFLFFTLGHDWMYKMHGKWFSMSVEKFDAIHYAAMAFFKLGFILLFLIPYLALRIVI